MSARHHRLVILGSGPAGYTAAVYAARAHLASASIALKQDRPGAAEASMDAADALLEDFRIRAKAYRGE